VGYIYSKLNLYHNRSLNNMLFFLNAHAQPAEQLGVSPERQLRMVE
jgi:hypothetical protein